jgi:hypothetical protein
MNTFQRLIRVSGLGLALVLGFLWAALSSTERADPRSEIDLPRAQLRAAPSEADSEALARAELEVMKLEIDLLREQLHGLRAEQEALDRALGEREPVAPETATEQPASDDAEATGAERSAEERVRARIDVLVDRLEQEVPDSSWTAWVEAELEGGLVDAGIEGAALAATECRATMCRVRFAFDDAQSRDEALESLPFLIPWDGDGFFHLENGDPLRAVAYVAREGEALP